MERDTQRLGVCYYPEHWSSSQWHNDARRMREAGIAVVRVGEFAWSRIEPAREDFQFDWLAEAIDILSAEGLSIILGTPTATPPAWLTRELPGMFAVDSDGRERGFGSRRHYCFSHAGYRAECVRIATELGKRFGEHPAVEGWQIDNEYGCHDTVLSYSDSARAAFRIWLRAKYETVDVLNRRWGNVFWSMEYPDFDTIDLPNVAVTVANPVHWLDFYRFSSDQVCAFHGAQAQVLRACSSGRDIIHNFMGRVLEFDHFALGADIDVAAWDVYPLGFLADRVTGTDAHRQKFLRSGDPDFQALHHDLYRACGNGRWSVMEQQPGPVNWARYNPLPRDGMVRLWSWEAFAHGAEVVSYFRWRQLPFGQEQMHTGLIGADDRPAPGLKEVAQVSGELSRVGGVGKPEARVALLFDYESYWAWRIQPHADGFDYFDVVFDFYRGLRRLGIAVDFVSIEATNFDAYKLLFVPALFHCPDALTDALRGYDGLLLLGPRTASKTQDFAIAPCLGPAVDAALLDATVKRVDSLPATHPIPVGTHGAFKNWREIVETGGAAEVLLATDDGEAALVRQGRVHYLCGWPNADLLADVLLRLTKRAEIDVMHLPDDVRLCRQAGHSFFFNYGSETFDLSTLGIDGEYVLGGARLEPAGVAVVKST